MNVVYLWIIWFEVYALQTCNMQYVILPLEEEDDEEEEERVGGADLVHSHSNNMLRIFMYLFKTIAWFLVEINFIKNKL